MKLPHNEEKDVSDIEKRISNIENFLKWLQCPEPIVNDIKALILSLREIIKGTNDPSDKTIMKEARRIAVINGIQFSKITRDQLIRILAEVIQKYQLKKPNQKQSKGGKGGRRSDF